MVAHRLLNSDKSTWMLHHISLTSNVDTCVHVYVLDTDSGSYEDLYYV